jgi:hypothetical protein
MVRFYTAWLHKYVQDCGFGLHIQRFFIDDPVGELFGISGYLRAYIEKRQSGFTVNKSFNYYRPVIFLSSLVSIPSSLPILTMER